MRQAGEHRLRVMLEQAQASGATYNSCVFSQPSWPTGLIIRTYPSTIDLSSIDAPSQHRSRTPMAYSFLPSLDGHDYRDPPTPVSLPSPSNTLNANDFFESYVDDILHPSSQEVPTSSRQPINSSVNLVQTTPTIARTLASTSITHEDIESPDPLAMSNPSPSKKARLDNGGSPPRTHSGLKIKLNVNKSSSGSLSVGEGSVRPAVRKLTPEVVINVKRKSASPKKVRVEDPESSGDELDWGDEGEVDQEGDYRMSDPAFISPSPTRRIEPKGSGRTGERDQRCEFRFFQSSNKAEQQRISKNSTVYLKTSSRNPIISQLNYLPKMFSHQNSSRTSL
jgi:hypothetical protein